MAEAVNKAGGGVVEFKRGATYLVGHQTQGPVPGGYDFEPDKIMEFIGCTKPLVLRGNGAKIKCADGLKFGTFDVKTGEPTNNPMPFYNGQIASPYRWMIKVEGATSSVVITDIELDGNIEKLQIGGPWGDTGRQLPATGIGLYNNTGIEIVRNVYSHHHALDGLILDDVSAPADDATTSDAPKTTLPLRTFENVRAEYNARQGASIVGGANYSFTNCKFNHTGKAVFYSSPGGGVDIEAEAKRVRDLKFTSCEFSDNSGPGMVADQGDSSGAVFQKCTFIGTTKLVGVAQ